MKVQFHKSQYSTVGMSSCLVHVQWMKDQSTTVNLCLFRGGETRGAGGAQAPPSFKVGGLSPEEAGTN